MVVEQTLPRLEMAVLAVVVRIGPHLRVPVAQETLLLRRHRKVTTAVVVLAPMQAAVVVAVLLQQGQTELLLVVAKAATELHLQLVDRLSPMQEAAAVERIPAHIQAQQAAQAAQVVVALVAPASMVMAPQARLTQVVVAAAQLVMLSETWQAAPAAPASSSFPMPCPSETRSSLSPQQRGLHRLAQRRWIISLLRVAQVVADINQALAAVVEAEPVGLELARHLALPQARSTS